MQITINAEPLFEFSSYAEWVNKAQGWFGNLNLSKAEKTVCIDPNGNILTVGADFKIADCRNLFPVKVFRLVRTSESFPKFWYESNACWGNVESLGDLSKMAALQLAESNTIGTIDDFLDKSVRVEGDDWNFGTRREHKSDYSLRQFLALNNLLGDFFTYFSSYRR